MHVLCTWVTGSYQCNIAFSCLSLSICRDTQTEEGILHSQLSDLTTPRRDPLCRPGGPTESQAPPVPSMSDAELLQGRNLPTLHLGTDKPCLVVGGDLQRKSLVDMESEIEEEEEKEED